MFKQQIMIWPVCAICAFLLGCGNTNAPLNSTQIALESRARNSTRSAVFADTTLPGDTSAGGILRIPRAVVSNARPGPRDSDGVFVGLALSGGGSRAANFAAACMFQLQRVDFLRHVDYISSVSGSSLTAALYCTSDEKSWNPHAVQKALTYRFADELLFQILLPTNTAAFAVSDWGRSDLLAGILRDHLFSKNGRALTYADLNPDRPRLLINSTDLQTGHRFVFCNEAFDQLNSDLAKFPLCNAVAASAAFPVLLSPVTLRDYTTDFAQYRHLIDGGVADNLGIQTLVETYTAQVNAAASAGVPNPYPHGAVFVIVSAETRFNVRLSDQSGLGFLAGISNSLGLSSTLVDRASSATLAETIVNGAPDDVTARELRDYITQLNTDGFVRIADKTRCPIRVMFISLSQLDGLKNLPFASFSDSVNSIATYFNIAPSEAYDLYEAADLLMKDKLEANFREVVKEIEASETETRKRPANMAPTTRGQGISP